MATKGLLSMNEGSWASFGLLYPCLHCMKIVQRQSVLWSEFSCIRTRKNSVFGHISCNVIVSYTINSNFSVDTVNDSKLFCEWYIKRRSLQYKFGEVIIAFYFCHYLMICLTIWHQVFLEFWLVDTWFFAHPRDQRTVTRLENVGQLNIRRCKKLNFLLSHRQPST